MMRMMLAPRWAPVLLQFRLRGPLLENAGQGCSGCWQCTVGIIGVCLNSPTLQHSSSHRQQHDAMLAEKIDYDWLSFYIGWVLSSTARSRVLQFQPRFNHRPFKQHIPIELRQHNSQLTVRNRKREHHQIRGCRSFVRCFFPTSVRHVNLIF